MRLTVGCPCFLWCLLPELTGEMLAEVVSLDSMASHAFFMRLWRMESGRRVCWMLILTERGTVGGVVQEEHSAPAV